MQENPQTAQTISMQPVEQVATQQSVMSIEEGLLQGQPPGTIIKCVTAQVITTEQGPRIVLQGLVGNDFTQQQLVLVQQQVKQQLLKGKFCFRSYAAFITVKFPMKLLSISHIM